MAWLGWSALVTKNLHVLRDHMQPAKSTGLNTESDGNDGDLKKKKKSDDHDDDDDTCGGGGGGESSRKKFTSRLRLLSPSYGGSVGSVYDACNKEASQSKSFSNWFSVGSTTSKPFQNGESSTTDKSHQFIQCEIRKVCAVCARRLEIIHFAVKSKPRNMCIACFRKLFAN